MTLKIGDTIYRFDINRRRYDKTGLGARIIYREHFEPYQIGGETKQSWLITDGYGIVKVNKATMREAGKNGYSGYQWFTAAGMEDNIWQKEHRPNISRMVEGCSIGHLRQIADLLGYAPRIANTGTGD